MIELTNRTAMIELTSRTAMIELMDRRVGLTLAIRYRYISFWNIRPCWVTGNR